MSFARKTLTDLQNEAAQDLADAGPLLRFSNLGIVGKALANQANDHYGYLDYIAKQSNPYTATDEFLEAWAALKGVYRKAASNATGSITFTGVPTTVIGSGLTVVRTDGTLFTTTSSATVSGGGTATVTAEANPDDAGLTGAFGNTIVGVQMALAIGIVGVQTTGVVSTAFVGGADLESDDDLRTRMLEAYQNPPQGGSAADYELWALQVPGITRAWCVRNGMGVGTVSVFFMMDDVESAYDGFPQGDNGVATNEPRDVTATGDQLILADYLYDLQPVTALVYAVAPAAHAVNFTISGILSGSQAAVLVAIADVFYRNGVPSGTIYLADVWSAISAITGVTDFIIASPVVDIVCPSGTLPTVGTVSFT